MNVSEDIRGVDVETTHMAHTDMPAKSQCLGLLLATGDCSVMQCDGKISHNMNDTEELFAMQFWLCKT